MIQPLDSHPPSAPPMSGMVTRGAMGSDPYRRVLEELSVVLSPVVARQVLDGCLAAGGASPEDAAAYDLRFAVQETLPEALDGLLRDPDEVAAVLASLEEALVSAHRPPRVGESGNLSDVLSQVGPARPTSVPTAPAPPPAFSTVPPTPLGGSTPLALRRPSLTPARGQHPMLRFSSPVPSSTP